PPRPCRPPGSNRRVERVAGPRDPEPPRVDPQRGRTAHRHAVPGTRDIEQRVQRRPQWGAWERHRASRGERQQRTWEWARQRQRAPEWSLKWLPDGPDAGRAKP